MEVVCIGAGPAGLYFAIQTKLHDPASDVTVFERNPAGVTDGWGVVFWEDLLSTLRESDPESAHQILQHSFCWTGQTLDVKGKERVALEGGGFGICRRQLLTILTNRALALGVKIAFEHKIGDPSQLPSADLIVAADGAGSGIRSRNNDHFKTRVTLGRNKYVWLGTSRVFQAFTFGFVPTSGGWIWFHAYGFAPDMSTFIVECSSETWAALGFSHIDAHSSLRLLETIFEEHLKGCPLRSRGDEKKNLKWLNFRSIVNERWYMDKIVLLGDAAHTTHFSIGSGTRLAIQDATTLSNFVRNHCGIESALKLYERTRERALRVARREAHYSAAWFENVPAYINFEAPQLFSLLRNRRYGLIRYLPPSAYPSAYRARAALLRVPVLRTAYRGAARLIRGI